MQLFKATAVFKIKEVKIEKNTITFKPWSKFSSCDYGHFGTSKLVFLTIRSWYINQYAFNVSV